MMLTIAGSGMSDYHLNNLLTDIDLSQYDYIALDSNYLKNKDNNLLLNKYLDKIISGQFHFIKEKITEILENDKQKSIIYIVTGSPIFYSGGTTLINHLKSRIKDFNPLKNAKIISNLSCKDYLINKLAIAEQLVTCVSLHARDYPDLTHFIVNKYTLILADNTSLTKLRDLLAFLSPTDYRIILASHLGYPSETIIEIDDIDQFLYEKNIDQLMPYVLLIERRFERTNPFSEDNDYLQDSGMITKAFKRRFSLQELDLKPNILLWDIGAGSGSVGIEAYKAFNLRTIFFEKNIKRINDLKENLRIHRVIGARVVEGDVITTSTNEIEHPDRIFIGGGGESVAHHLPFFCESLKHGGILLANYVTMNYLATAIKSLQKKGIEFSIKSISLTTFKNKELNMAEPERLLFQLKVIIK